jgi:hypothetical protein
VTRVLYDPEADVLVVKLREGAVADEELLDNDAIVGYDRARSWSCLWRPARGSRGARSGGTGGRA